MPLARDAQALESLAYDNWSNALNLALDPGSLEIGNQITLQGSQGYLSRFALEYWGTNSLQAGFAGTVTARVRFYQNDGPALDGQPSSPGTLFYDSGALPITATNRGALVLQEFALSAAVPLAGSLPSSFTWTVQFAGLGSNDAAGLNFYGPPVSGQVLAGYWAQQTNGWSLQGTAGQAFGGQLSTLSSGTSLTVLSTVTNAGCARSFSATRTWQALDACGNASTCSQTVSVLDQSAPLLVSQPQDQSVLAGKTITLSVNVLSCPPIGYQWFFNASNLLANATNASLTLSNAAFSDSGNYQVVVTNSFGSVTSAPAILVVAPPPAIDTNPVNVTATNGDTVTFSVQAHGTGALSYQWFFNGTNQLLGATGATLTVTNVTTGDAGNYRAIVFDQVGNVTSTPAQLTVLVTPIILSGEGPLAIPDVGSVDSHVLVSGQTAPLARVEVGVYITHTYDADLRISVAGPDGTTVLLSTNNGQFGQNYGTNCAAMTWFSDLASNSITVGVAPFVGVFEPQQPLAAFIGKSGAGLNGLWTLHVEDTGPQDVGTLQCWFLKLVPQGCPADGTECLIAPQIVQDLSDQVITNGMDATFAINVIGTSPITYQWFFNVTNSLANATNTSLTLTNVGSAQAGIYSVVASNAYGVIPSILANLSLASPPQILGGPSDQVATNGDDVVLKVSVQGSAPLQYQWYFNFTNVLSGATNNTLTLSQVTPAQAGTYDVAVANAFGSVTSAPANLQVFVIPTIVCSSDFTVPLGTAWAFTGPAYSDTNLTLQLLGTSTNILCAESFSATRQWLVSDTNGYQVTCSQTVQVLNTNPPLLSCAGDKSVVYGNPWTFDVPLARDAQALESLAYDNWSNALNLALDPGSLEIGNQITLQGSQGYLSRFALEYWGTNSLQAGFAGTVTARVRFYQNDGPALDGQPSSPGTLFYDSGALPITATNRGALVLQEFALSAAVPLAGSLPSSFTWTVQFAGLGSNDAAGLHFYGPPVSGQVLAGYWAQQTHGWRLQGRAGQAWRTSSQP